jgi:polyphosphate kinase
MERLQFLSIVSSNLDEFFLIRVAGLTQVRAAGLRRRDPSGMTARQQLRAISERVHRMVAEQSAGIAEVLAALGDKGVALLRRHEWSPQQAEFLKAYFEKELAPILTPLAPGKPEAVPLLPSLQLNVGVILAGPGDEAEPTIVVIPVPSGSSRFVALPASGRTELAPLEEVISVNAETLFPNHTVVATTVFRITRDADVAIDEDEAGDILEVVEQAIQDRRRRTAVRLEISANPHGAVRAWLAEILGVTDEEVYEIDGLLDAAALMEVASRHGPESLHDADWPPQPPQGLVGAEDLWSAIRARDVLLTHPYESFDSVVELVDLAADDANVRAIKQTLYRTSGDSPIIQALERAALAGKQVTVLVELKARFDESRNVEWARRLENAGCHVIYGVAGYKTHAKALLVVRQEGGVVRRYVHLSTGPEIAAEVSAFFNLVTGGSDATELTRLTMAPTGMRRRFHDLIEREIDVSTPGQPGLIMAKVNSLEDPDICLALARAGQAGVKVMLNVRGICCLRPGVKGLSENVDVVSIVDRFLEHARVFYFRNGGHEEVYLSSADWMGRNLDKRLELLFPILDADLRRRIVGYLEVYFADNLKARRLLADGTYEPIRRPGKAVRSQLELYQGAVAAVKRARQSTVRFRPLRRPES